MKYLSTSVSEGVFLKCLAIFFRQEIVNQKLDTHPWVIPFQNREKKGQCQKITFL